MDERPPRHASRGLSANPWASGAARRVATLLGTLALCGSVPAEAAADLQRVEAVGIYGIREDARTRVIARDEAIAHARWEGVSRVALELIGESGLGGSGGVDGDGRATGDPVVSPIEAEDGSPNGGDGSSANDAAPGETDEERLERALGRDTLPYTRSYRILEDQGERPVLFAEKPSIKSEYVVVVEVIVDVGRVQEALERAGLVSSAATGAVDSVLTVELVGLSRFAAFEQVLAVLRGSLGATRVQTLEFASERQVLSVEGPFGLEGLADRLAGYRDQRLVLEPIAMDREGGRLRVLGRWYPARDGAAGAGSGRSLPPS